MTIQRSQLFALIAWTQVFIGVATSLFFSEVVGLIPCNLCWYQRIALYPLVIIIAVGLVRKETHYVWYSLPLAIMGWVIAVYHNLIYYKVIPAASFTCNALISCTEQYSIFGFSIPLLSFIAFTIILGSLYFVIKTSHHEQRS